MADAAAFKPIDRAATESHDRHFADDFVWLEGAPLPISRTLARQMYYQVDNALPWTVGRDPGPAGENEAPDIFDGA